METTLVKADDKGRVCIRGTRKGAKYLVTAENGGWWIMPAPKITVPEKWNRPPGPGNCAPPRWKVFMINPKPGEVYWVDLGLKGKLRPLLVVSREDAEAERALCVCVPLTTQIRGGDYEVKLPRVRWLPGADEGVANVQGLTSVENHRLERRAGQFEARVTLSVRDKIAWLLELN